MKPAPKPKHPGGRPKSKCPLRTESIEIKLRPSEKAAYQACAFRAGRTLSEWVRDQCDRAAIREASK